jgi:hypothetical protein
MVSSTGMWVLRSMLPQTFLLEEISADYRYTFLLIVSTEEVRQPDVSILRLSELVVQLCIYLTKNMSLLMFPMIQKLKICLLLVPFLSRENQILIIPTCQFLNEVCEI